MNQLQPISTAPADGTRILGYYGEDDDEPDLIFWQEEGRCCMLGPRNGSYPPGWSDDYNRLPVDDPTHWAP